MLQHSYAHNFIMVVKKSLVLLLLLLYFFVVDGQTTCTPSSENPSCVCTLDDGRTIDLRSVGDSSGKPRFSDTEGTYSYTYNPCYPYTSGPCTGVAACQMDNGDTGRSLAVQDGVTYSIVDANVLISYVGGKDDRTAAVTLKCGVGASTISFDGESPRYNYQFTLTSQCACPGKCDEKGPKEGGGGENGGSGGSNGVDPGVVGIVLLCVFFFAVVIYFVVGMIILKVKFEKTGSGIIPHKNFWFSLPLLVKDGVMFTFSPCIKYRRGYSNVK